MRKMTCLIERAHPSARRAGETGDTGDAAACWAGPRRSHKEGAGPLRGSGESRSRPAGLRERKVKLGLRGEEKAELGHMPQRGRKRERIFFLFS